MDFVVEQLKRLNKQIAIVTSDVEDAWDVYKKTEDPEDRRHFEGLKKEKEQLDFRRAELEAQLPGAGERPPLPASAAEALPVLLETSSQPAWV